MKRREGGIPRKVIRQVLEDKQKMESERQKVENNITSQGKPDPKRQISGKRDWTNGTENSGPFSRGTRRQDESQCGRIRGEEGS